MTSFAVEICSSYSQFRGLTSQDDTISSNLSRASVLAERKARHFASVVQYSFRGIDARLACTLISFSQFSMRDRLRGNKLICISAFSADDNDVV
jgi:hypothetical protein